MKFYINACLGCKMYNYRFIKNLKTGITSPIVIYQAIYIGDVS